MSQRHADPVAPAPVPAARASRRETATRRLGLALAAPALLYILVFLAFPLLYNLWLPLRTCYQVYLFAVTLATCLIAYFSFAKITASRRLGLLGALLYTLSAYRLTCVYTRAAVGVVLAAANYPDEPQKGDVISGLDAGNNVDVKLFQAGTAEQDGQVVTAGGRVLCATALGHTVAEAQKNAYSPYSNFKVGAAILMKDHNIIKGCNIENASFGMTNCAEDRKSVV